MKPLKEIIREILPPILSRGLGRLFRRINRSKNDYFYCSEGWPKRKFSGWNTKSVVDAYESGWNSFLIRTQSTGPLELNLVDSMTSESNLSSQNIKLVFAYAFGRASQGKLQLSVLDWGGSLGHYYVLARSLFPEISLDWTVIDLPLLCETGKKLLPEVRFTSNLEEILHYQYDLVFASSVLQYYEDWRVVCRNLYKVTGNWLLISRLPICLQSNDFVLIQQSYDTIYPGWVINRTNFLSFMEKECRLQLVREFSISSTSKTIGAPDSWEQRGFLFQKTIRF